MVPLLALRATRGAGTRRRPPPARALVGRRIPPPAYAGGLDPAGLERPLCAARGSSRRLRVLHLDGEPRTDASGGLEAATLEADALASLDRAAYGFDRAVDHAYWRAGPATGTLWLRDGDPCAYSYVWPGGRIGPIAGADGAASADALRTELARADGTAGVVVPGSAPLLVRLAVDAGLRFTKPPGLLLLGGEATPPAALALSSYTLF